MHGDIVSNVRENLHYLDVSIFNHILSGRNSNMKWVCKVCGYVYEGDELPEDYVCPLCGVGPEEFEKIEE